jgi:hypothetical protein
MRFVTDLSKGILGKPDSVELWNEIISHIPDSVLLKDDVKILCPAVGHGSEADVIVRRMHLLGRTADEIKNSIYLLDKYRVFTKALQRKGYTNIICADFLGWETDMKFDVVIGNPPYQNPHGVNSHALWENFIEKSHELVNQNGYVAMVTPHIGRRKIKQKFFDNDFIFYKSEGVEKFFPSIGSTFCYHIVRNSSTGVKTKVGNSEYNLSKYGFIPSNINEEVEELLDELFTGTPLNVQGGGIHGSNKHLFSDTQNKEFPYKYQHTSSQTKYCSKKCKAMEHKLKVVCSKSGYLKPWLDKDHIGITEGSWCVPVSSVKEGQKVIEFLNSDKIKLFNQLSGSNTAAHDPNKYKLLCIK